MKKTSLFHKKEPDFKTMLKRKFPKSFTVSLEDLTAQMKIIAYTGFSSIYKPVQPKTIQWLQLNFKNTMAAVIRNREVLQVPIVQLQIKDHLEVLYNFSDSLSKLIYVTPFLIRELERRNFTQFQVILLEKTEEPVVKKWENQKEKEYQLMLNKITQFIEKTNETLPQYSKISNVLEETMDKARVQKFNHQEIEHHAQTIVDQQTSESLAALSSLKQSDQTYSHCIDVGNIFQHIYWKLVNRGRISGHFKDEKTSLLAGFLHDFGKSKIPKEILDSQIRFEPGSKEMQIMRKHPEYGAKLLRQFNFPTTSINMCHYHHVKYDVNLKNSYPMIDDYKAVSYETRLLSIIDIYQALIGKRSYKKSWNPANAIAFIGNLTSIEFDPVVWMDFISIVGKYPVNSYVELSDGSFGFVTNLPYKDMDKPTVIIVENQDREILSHNPIVNLSKELDISIVKTHDAQDRFKEKTLETFLNLKAT